MPNTTIKRRLKPRPKALWVLAGLGATPIRITEGTSIKIKREISKRWIVRKSKRQIEHARLVGKWKIGRRCKVCGERKIDAHHSRGRAGPLLNDQRFWIPLCREHHDWVGANPEMARAKGLLCAKGLWNVPERDLANGKLANGSVPP